MAGLRSLSASHLAFPIIIASSIALVGWPSRWLFSGAPFLTYCLMLGGDDRILPFIPLWTLVTLLNLVYAVSATSWLFYWIFTVVCYPAIFVACMFQFGIVARFVRRRLGLLLRSLHFTNDSIAFFNIPALEIDTDVDGLMVIRGVTVSLSRLSVTAHGVEVGIKLSEEMELSIQVEEVRVLFFRRIEVGHVYANLKGGIYEMTFGNLAKRATGDSLMVSDTPLLEAAALKGNTTRPDLSRMTSKFTNGAEPQHGSVKAGLGSLTQITPTDHEAERKYQKALAYISKTSAIQEAIEQVQSQSLNVIEVDSPEMRANICSQLHDKPSVPHPPLRSIKVTTLQNLSSPHMRRFLHRLPFLLRLLLNPMSYFHPVMLKSVTAGGSGKYLQYTLQENVFKHYGEQDSGIRKLESRISAWLADANFVLQLVGINGDAQVPLTPSYEILTNFKIGQIIAFRTQPELIDLKEVVRLGGADASIRIPSFLLPHHEHLLPPIPDEGQKRHQEQKVENADSKPEEVYAEVELERVVKDETQMKLSVHASLPAVFDQELLDFIAALVKAVKIIEMEKDPEPDDTDSLDNSKSSDSPRLRGIRDAAMALRTNVRDGMRRVGVDTVLHDKWIAKLVGKVTKKLENALGDIGYSGEIPISLQPYRAVAEKDLKILP